VTDLFRPLGTALTSFSLADGLPLSVLTSSSPAFVAVCCE